MFNVTLTNQSSVALQASDGAKIGPKGGTWKFAGGPGRLVGGRYEGGGQLNLAVNQFLQVGLSGMDFREVQLDGLVLSG